MVVFSCMSVCSYSHPGVGIVMDRRGNVYYTDLKQVIRLDQAGKKTIVVQDVHTHELYLDEEDNLFGEHLWYEGEASNKWGHYVWKLSVAGKYEKIIPNTEGFLSNYSFVRDHFGRMYWTTRTNGCQKVARRNQDASITTLGDQCFKNIRWMKSTADGIVYVVDFQDIKKIDTQGKVKTLASQIANKKFTESTVDNQNSVMGVWDDREGNIYTAIYSSRMVKKFNQNGTEEVVAKISFPWAPSGGMVDPAGNLWVLESNIVNSVRVEKFAKNGRRTTY